MPASTPTFIHLKVHSEYSIVDSLVRIPQLLQRAVDLHLPAVALTDEMNLCALIKFYQEALQRGIKPIIGAELLWMDGKDLYRLTALCQNTQGFQHLIQLLSRAYVERGNTDTVCIQREWLWEWQAGLILLSGGRDSDIARALLQGRVDLATERLKLWLQHFPDRFYLELQRSGRHSEKEYIDAVLPLAAQYRVPVVATNDVRFLQGSDFEAHETRVCIHQGHVLDDDRRPRQYSDQQYFKSAEEMKALFADIPEALQNSGEIAKRCTVSLSLGEIFLPQFPVPTGVNVSDYFSHQAEEKLVLYLQDSATIEASAHEKYQLRLQTELHVINTMGFSGYFLIVADFIGWARRQGIPVGPGRGSGAGSLVAFLLGITALDPLQHELLFERFLNLERVSLPDFDIDFCMEGRDRVIDYVAQRYGSQAVAQIITYGTLAARAVLRDVGRVLGMPYGYVDKIAKLVPFEIGMTLQKALHQEPLFVQMMGEDNEAKNLIELAQKLEGLVRNAGKHAGGVVIAPTKLTDFVPLYRESGGEHLLTQFDKDDVETVGLVKFDFLGLRTLTIINEAVKNVNAQKSETAEKLDISRIPLDDKETYALLKQCATTAVFQLESHGMKELIRRLQPDNFGEIMALVALFRPGPLQSGMVDTFIACKHGKQPVHYPHPRVEPILRSTYGVILYQEQVMQIAQVLAGYSLGDADVLRHAMGKKKAREMEKQRAVFIAGASADGVDKQIANDIFDLMEKFSGYGFNKSHSAAYALIAYQTAWLKAHYPAEFMAAVLSSDMDNTDKMGSLVAECRVMHLVVKPPQINHSHYRFTVTAPREITYGLGAIKGVGAAVIQHILDCRSEESPFNSLFDFMHRVDFQKISRRALEPLIRSGAMDCFGVSRASLYATIDKARHSAEQHQRNARLGQDDLFRVGKNATLDPGAVEYILISEWSDRERLAAEKETLGLYFTGHPLNACENELKTIVKSTIDQLQAADSNTVIAGLLTGLRRVQTRRGKRMAILTLEDQTGRIEVTLFPDIYLQVAMILNKDAILIIRGTVSADTYTGGVRIVADTVLTLDQLREQRAKRLVIHLPDSGIVPDFLPQLSFALKPYTAGTCAVVIVYSNGQYRAELVLGEAWKVKPNDDLLNGLQKLCGKEHVELEYGMH